MTVRTSKPSRIAGRHKYEDMLNRLMLMSNDDLTTLANIFDRASIEADMDAVDETSVRQADAYDRQAEVCENISEWCNFWLDARKQSPNK